MGIKSYENLKVYKKGYELALKVHQTTLNLPDYEKYELGSQLRRAALSIPLNIAEGYGRSGQDFKRFLGYSLGSANEVMVLLQFSQDLGYTKTTQLIDEYDVLGKQLYHLRKNWN